MNPCDNSNNISKSRIRWQCRRGMLELDVLFERFFEAHYDNLSLEQKNTFARLLSLDDPTLYDWLVASHPVEDKATQSLIKMISETKR